jgi:intracellular septation protein A
MSDPVRAHAPSQPASDARTVDRRAMMLGFLLTAVFDVGVALVAFRVAKHLGADDRIAYLASAIGPAIMLVITWIRARTLGGASVVILLFLLFSAAATFIGGGDPRLLIAKDSVVTGAFGAACLLSTLLPRPLMFYFGAKFGTDGSREGIRYWSGLWRYPDFRRSMYLINTAWGVGFLIEAAVRILVAYTVSSFQTANTIATILPFAFLAVLITYTIWVGNRTRAAAQARIASAGGTAPQPAVG